MDFAYRFFTIGAALGLASCAAMPTAEYPERNTTPSNLVNATDCGEPGAMLSMMTAPVAISQSSANCNSATVLTAVVRDDAAHSLASACRPRMGMELYYSRSREALAQLPNLASQAAGANFQLPASVGRLVEQQTNMSLPAFAEHYIRTTSATGPNRARFTATIPPFLVDLARGGTAGASLDSSGTLFYKWAKHLEKDDGRNPTVFSETFQMDFIGAVSVDAGPRQVINAPQQSSANLRGTVRPANATVSSVAWVWIVPPARAQAHVSWPAPAIASPNSLSTAVGFNTHGNHEFELTVTDSCRNSSTDKVIVQVDGQYVDPPGNNVIMVNGDRCEREGTFRLLKNLSANSITVRLSVFEDWTAWLSDNTPFAGETREFEQEVVVGPNAERPLGCTESWGAGSTSADKVSRTWRILSERIN